MPISATRFEAEIAQKILINNGFKISIFHIMWLKPFKITKKLIETVNSSKCGALILDNDFEYGIPSILSHQLSQKVNKKISVMGLKNKTAGHHHNVDNLPPNAEAIINKVIIIIKNK